MPVTQPSVVPLTTAGRVFIFGQEKATYGTAALAADLVQEPVMSVDLAPQRETVDDTAHSGVASDLQGIDEATHYEQFTVRLSTRPNGFAAYMQAGMMGPITYTVTGSAVPYSHPGATTYLVPAATSNILPTWTAWYRASLEGTTTKQMLASTPTSLHFTFAQNAELSCEAQLWSKFASNQSLPSPTTVIGRTDEGAGAATDVTRLMSTRGTFSIIGNSGSAYSTRVLSGDFTLTRPLEVCTDCTSRDAYYLKAGNLAFAGNLVVVFEGYGSGTVEEDFRGWKPGGTVSTPNLLRWTASDGTYMEWSSAPWHLTAFSLDESGQYIKANISFRAYNDPAGMYAATPVLSVVQCRIVNNVSTRLVVP